MENLERRLAWTASLASTTLSKKIPNVYAGLPF